MDGWRLHFTPIEVVYADRVIVNRVPCSIPSNDSFLWIGLKVQFEHASVIFSFPNHLVDLLTKHIISVLPYLFFFNVWHWETISDFHNPVIIYAQKSAKHTRLSFISHYVVIEDAEHHNRMESTISSAIP